jgi:hypothetical protein
MTHHFNPQSNCCGAPLSVGGKPCDELLVIAAELDGNT